MTIYDKIKERERQTEKKRETERKRQRETEMIFSSSFVIVIEKNQ